MTSDDFTGREWCVSEDVELKTDRLHRPNDSGTNGEACSDFSESAKIVGKFYLAEWMMKVLLLFEENEQFSRRNCTVLEVQPSSNFCIDARTFGRIKIDIICISFLVFHFTI